MEHISARFSTRPSAQAAGVPRRVGPGYVTRNRLGDAVLPTRFGAEAKSAEVDGRDPNLTSPSNYTLDAGRIDRTDSRSVSQHNLPKPATQPGKQSNRIALTESALADASKQWQKQSAQPAAKGLEQDVHDGITSAEVLPDDSISLAVAEASHPVDHSKGSSGFGGEDMSAAPLILSDEDWNQKLHKVFASLEDFQRDIAAWISQVSIVRDPEGNISVDGDPDTGDLHRTPEALDVLRDASSLHDEEMEARRATQTANSVCKMQEWLQLDDGVETAPASPHVSTLSSPQTQSPPSVRFLLRMADGTDIESMRDIYNEEVLKGTQAWGNELATLKDFQRLLVTSRNSNLPVVVAFAANEDDKQIMGLGFLAPARPVWKNAIAPADESNSVQAQVYVRMKYRNQGVGSGLIGFLLSAVSDNYSPRKDISVTSTNAQYAGDAQGNQCTGLPEDKPSRRVGSTAEKIHFVIVEILYGSENGMMEREYERVLTQSFGFYLHPDPCDSLHWYRKGSRWIKVLKFYHQCQKTEPTRSDDSISEGLSEPRPLLLTLPPPF